MNVENFSPEKLADTKEYLLLCKEMGWAEDIIVENKNQNSIPEPAFLQSLLDMRNEVLNCKKCGLSDTRTNVVFGEGCEKPQICFVGEAPGRDEDLQGKPFVGKAGQLLTRMIQAMGFSRETVYIANILKCRPPNNRNPLPDEIDLCEPFLVKQLEILSPKVIIALGTFAAQTLLKTDEPIGRLRGRFHQYQNIPLMPTYHPAFLLRNPWKKRDVWNDLRQVMAFLQENHNPEND